jgi:hypothetical protein
MRELPYLLRCKAHDSEEGLARMIHARWQLIASIAWSGYSRSGRGVVVLDLNNSESDLTGTGMGMAMTYCDVDLLSRIGWSELAESLQSYDPHKDVIVAIVHRSGHHSFESYSSSGQLPDPPEAYRRQQQPRLRINPECN